MTQINTHTCSRCGTEKPLDREHFQPDKSSSRGFKARCRACDNEVRAEQRRKKLDSMSTEEWEAARARENERQRKYKKARKAKMTPEERHLVEEREWIQSEGAPALREYLYHWRLVSRFRSEHTYTDRQYSAMYNDWERNKDKKWYPNPPARTVMRASPLWADFYRTVLTGLASSYGVRISESYWSLSADRGEPPESNSGYASYLSNPEGFSGAGVSYEEWPTTILTQSEIYKRLVCLNRDIYEGPSFKVERKIARYESLPDELKEYVWTHDPKTTHARPSWERGLSPALLREIDEMPVTVDQNKFAEASELSKAMLLLQDAYGPQIIDLNADPLERKWAMRANDTVAVAAEEQLSSIPRETLQAAAKELGYSQVTLKPVVDWSKAASVADDDDGSDEDDSYSDLEYLHEGSHEFQSLKARWEEENQ